MAGFLKFVSAAYLIIVWFVVAVLIGMPAASGLPTRGGATVPLALLSGIVASIPAVALYAFGQVVADVRSMRDHLHAMRRYYEPGAPGSEPRL